MSCLFLIFSSDQSAFLDAIDPPQCDISCPVRNAFCLIPDDEDLDTSTSTSVVAKCSIGFAFPEGAREKRSKCQRVMDTNGVMTTQFENFDGECERKRL